MKTIYDRLNKVYDKTLLDQKDIRKHYRTICDLLEEYQIPHDEKSDDASGYPFEIGRAHV